MKICTLCTGSKGNATLVVSRKAKILIDCGVRISALEQTLKMFGCGFDGLDAVLITHEHCDHVFSLQALKNVCGAKIYVHEAGAESLSEKNGLSDFCLFRDSFEVNDVRVDALALSHDAPHTSAFRLTENENGAEDAFVSVTDTGILPEGFLSFVKDAKLVLIESNHDPDMLLYGDYVISLKKRIMGNRGHLSNFQCADAVKHFPNLNIKRVWLGHLSENNNTAELAFAASIKALESVDAREGEDITVEVIRQGATSGVADIGLL